MGLYVNSRGEMHHFRNQKFSTSSLQFQPKLFINSKIVPPVKNGESFTYFGRFFNFDMDNKDHKEILTSSLCIFIQKINYFCTISTSIPKSLGILQLQIWVRHGLQKTWITLSLNISVSGLSFPFLPL